MEQSRVLIVDDEPDIVESVRFRLEIENISCLTAFDGEDALAKAKKERPDLILLDVMLPKINGYKIARILKFDESYKNIPIIMLTARTQLKDVKIGKETGADEYITKPFDMEMLVEMVMKYLGDRAQKTTDG